MAAAARAAPPRPTSADPSSASSKPQAPEDERHQAGREIYNFRCYFCHGYSGNAKTLAASFLDPKPRDFSQTPLTELSRAKMIEVLNRGKPGTAMQSFAKTLSAREIEDVVDFVRREFMQNKAVNTYYHTKANGWDNHERYRDAFPFATGALALDTPDDQLTAAQLNGKRLFLSSCVTCHDRATVNEEGALWESRAVSYPRNQYSHVSGKADSVSSATTYARHDIAPKVAGLSPRERSGEAVFQANCAFCHAADGTGKNWIGSFLQPSPRDLTNPDFMSGLSKARLRNVIREGLPGTTMSAWKNVLSDSQIEDLISYIDKVFHPLAKTVDSGK